MRLERLTYNKIKIFLTTDDLSERGLCKDDIWKDSLKWHQLFDDMLREATEEFGVEINGPVAVEVFSVQAQGMVMIVTVDEPDQEEEENLNDGFIEMQVTVEGNDEIIFVFDHFEDVLQLAKRLSEINFFDGSLYSWDGYYYLIIHNLPEGNEEKIVANMAEYGNPSLLSFHRIVEYGKEIIQKEAVKTLLHYFN